MKVHIVYKEAYFVLENVERMGIMKHIDNETGRYRKFIFFKDTELGMLTYPLMDIKELITEDC